MELTNYNNYLKETHPTPPSPTIFMGINFSPLFFFLQHLVHVEKVFILASLLFCSKIKSLCL